MYSHVACDVMKERTFYLLKPSSLIWHLMPYLFLYKWCVTKVAHCMLMFQYAKLLCMSDETVQEIPVWSRTVFLPGVRSFGSEFRERTGTNP